MDIDRTLKLVAKAWGRQEGYCFFPVISGTAATAADRRASYDEGPSFYWPTDRSKILKWIGKHHAEGNDLYWCPMLFEEPRRLRDYAVDECALWADLDEVDPRSITDYPPTVAWESSPGRYQALWLLAGAQDIQGASWMGGENQRLTQHLGADQGGWDTTQLLRLPGWPNYKPDYRGSGTAGVRGDAPQGKLLWSDGRRWMPDEFEDLPKIEASALDMVAEDLIHAVDTKEVWKRLRLKVSSKVRRYMSAKDDTTSSPEGRSGVLWEIERELADAGATAAEIVALVRKSVWNKYDGRGDELQRLTIEAAKAIAARPTQVEAKLEAEREGYAKPTRLTVLLQGIQPPRWIVKDIWTEGACGFIAGQPKSFKSWLGLDLALSIGSGSPFLGTFATLMPGSVLYIQEEDPLPTLKGRYDKVWAERRQDRIEVRGDEVVWVPHTDVDEPDVDGYVMQGLVVSDTSWQDWLDEVLGDKDYRLALIDPLMMTLGDVDENRASDMMEKVFKPLKLLAQKHTTGICIVHHMRKLQGDNGNAGRGGQRMLGSVANHAWAQDSLYATYGKRGIDVERESKAAGNASFTVTNLNTHDWKPRPTKLKGLWDEVQDHAEEPQQRMRAPGVTKRTQGTTKLRGNNKLLGVIRQHGPLTRAEAAEITGLHYQTVYKQSKRLEECGDIVFAGGKMRAQ